MRAWRALLLVTTGALALVAAAAGAGGHTAQRPDACSSGPPSSDYVARVDRTLRATEDVWGNQLLASAAGPTYAGARRFLTPLVLARAAHGAALTQTGVHYVAFSGPVGVGGAGTMALHVADGSQVLSQRASGRSLTVAVGPGGNERYGDCLTRLGTPQLADGFLPILQTRYVDGHGIRYRQESFATRIAETRSLVSFVRLTVETPGAAPTIRFAASTAGLARRGDSLVRGGATYLAFAPGGKVEGSSVSYAPGAARTVYVAWLNSPSTAQTIRLDRTRYESERRLLARHWRQRLEGGLEIEVPERLVADAYRGLLVQNLALTWRYSVGNPYQQFSFPEGVDVAQVMSAHGYRDVARAILLRSFETPLTRYPNWKMGQKLVGCAVYYRLFRDRSFVAQVTPMLRGYVRDLGSQIRSSPRGILKRERFSSDIPDSVYGLHSQAVVWQGLRSLASIWAETGHQSLAAEARILANRLETGLRAAIRASQSRLPDGSLFIPMRLLDREQPYESVVQSRSGAYWNLVAPYAFASGLVPQGSPEARGIIRYLQLHGSRLLGLVRAGAYSLYGLDAAYPVSGVNPVYGLNVARFLADNDRPDQLVLSLYGQLAVAMTPGTHVAGEGVSVTPLGTDTYRSTYLPPNGASNASFLETLRLMLVHEVRGRDLESRGLELAYATPRAWLAAGKRIVVRAAPTTFGPLSYSIVRRKSTVGIAVDVPSRARIGTLRLRLRLPRGDRIAAVTLAGRPYRRFDAAEETIDLSGRTGHVELVALVQ